MAGADVSEDVFLQAATPIIIPTTNLELPVDNVPDRVLQAYLANYVMRNIEDAPQRTANVVTETVEEAKAETIQLKATFQPSYDTYSYQVSDLKNSVQDTPAFVKITKVPFNGNIVVQK